ncbi:hypothetical protein HOU67_gp38 [Escherichia phage Skarpretter]|uniref:Uncharacterized protein n=1 Tax=Escherichia phage Skarpretter TaxID=2488654 RepID=A0A3G8F2W4_9CAUD|nr:hypothetical protein HOU67_gp38 [Escherichia phage Skarpretter]AZF88674.1 hypothetical protein [Escherichia phage Skarpretter]
MRNPDKERYDRLVAEHSDPAKLTAEILAYWQRQAAEARALNEIYVAEILAKSNSLANSERDLRDAERRIDLLDAYQRIANQTGYQTPYILPACNVQAIEQEIQNAKAYKGPRITESPAVIGQIVYDPISKGGSGRWLFEPNKDAQIYNGDTVIGQVIGENGKQVTPNKHRHDQRRKQRK